MSSSQILRLSGILLSAKFCSSDPKLDSIGSLEQIEHRPFKHGRARAVNVLEAASESIETKEGARESLLEDGTFAPVTIFVKQKDLLLDDDHLRFVTAKCLERDMGHMFEK